MEKLRQIQNEIDFYCQMRDAKLGDVCIVAVSKKQPAHRLEALLKKGHRVFGENRIQEAKEKWPALKAAYPDIELHLIGPLQTNKAKEAIALFDVIETVDRKKLIDVLLKEMQKQNKWPTCFIQVNTGAEQQKSGVLPEDVHTLVSYALEQGLSVKGLMCIPPATSLSSPHFAYLKMLAKQFKLPLLSMGMSNDYKQAIMLGATHIRVGTALFGERKEI